MNMHTMFNYLQEALAPINTWLDTVLPINNESILLPILDEKNNILAPISYSDAIKPFTYVIKTPEEEKVLREKYITSVKQRIIDCIKLYHEKNWENPQILLELSQYDLSVINRWLSYYGWTMDHYGLGYQNDSLPSGYYRFSITELKQ